MNAFFKDQINYSPLVWMFHGHDKISKLHERYVRVTKILTNINSHLKNF